MRAESFLDTNVFVYAAAGRGDAESKRARALALIDDEDIGISAQVLQEFYVTVTRKLRPGIPVQDARDDVRALMTWRPVSADSVMLEAAWAAQDRYRLSWWDALIVSAAQVVGADYLLTEDLQAGQDLDSVVVVDPFQTAPEKLL